MVSATVKGRTADSTASTLNNAGQASGLPRSQGDARLQLLSAVAEAYYIDGLGQAEIADRFGFNRSAISRHLTEAREAGIVQIKVHREFILHDGLCQDLSSRSSDTKVYVVNTSDFGAQAASDIVARFTSRIVHGALHEDSVLAITMGTMVDGVARALSLLPAQGVEVVQMCGSVGASGPDVDAHAIVQRLCDAYRCKGTYLHAPFLVDDHDMLAALLRNPGNLRSVDRCKAATIALVGLGTLDPPTSSLAKGGHVTPKVMSLLKRRGAVGDVGGYIIDKGGAAVFEESYVPVLALSKDEFARIPARVGVAVGSHKAEVIAAALRGGSLTDLVTDSRTAEAVAASL